MIIDGILRVLLQPLILLLETLPALELSFNLDSFTINKYLNFINTFFPMKELMPLVIFNILILPGFGIAWTLILKIKSFFPTMGD